MGKPYHETPFLPMPPAPKSTPTRRSNLPTFEDMRDEIISFFREFLGTFLFMFIVFAGTEIAWESTVQHSTHSSHPERPPPDEHPTLNLPQSIYIAQFTAISLIVNMALFSNADGSMFNPAVTTALWIGHVISGRRAMSSILAQLLASLCVMAQANVLFPSALHEAITAQSSIPIPHALFVETSLSLFLVLTILVLPNSKVKLIYIGLAVSMSVLISRHFTGGDLNLARSCWQVVWRGFSKGEDFANVLGPIIGAIAGACVFAILKGINNETLQGSI